MSKAANKSIDLGALQDNLHQARRTVVADEKALAKAQDALDRSKQVLLAAKDALTAATRAVLD